MKTSFYLRVSNKSQAVDNQLPALQDYARVLSWSILEVYSESESAWKDGHQKELARLLLDCRNNRAVRMLSWSGLWTG